MRTLPHICFFNSSHTLIANMYIYIFNTDVGLRVESQHGR